MKNITLCWFRQDLRLMDNLALSYAAEKGQVLPIYILEDNHEEGCSLGAASQVWLHHSLLALKHSLHGNLSIYRGDPKSLIPQLVKKHNAHTVVWNRCYEPWRMARDQEIKALLSSLSLEVKSFNASLLWEPWQVTKSDGTPYKVFTPYYRKGCLQAAAPRKPWPKPERLDLLFDAASLHLDQLQLLPTIGWDKPLQSAWRFGEQAAVAQCHQFMTKGIHDYREGRNHPALPYVSRLSPYLHFGEISPHYIWQEVKNLAADDNSDHFCSELGWREFSYYLLYHHPELPYKNLHSKFDGFPWQNNPEHLKAWQRGQTGIPLVDAGMRELWQTGYMHNRVRMVVASFLVKNLLIDWRQGARWFWDCLVDADLANNSASWQWVAGCGADAAPYFRIFNPVMQSQKFDPTGEYIRSFVPELKKLPTPYLFHPWKAPRSVLEQAGVYLGHNYPLPLVDLEASRKRALEAFSSLTP